MTDSLADIVSRTKGRSVMEIKELRQRIHAVMDTYKINHRRDLAFLGEIAWIFGIEVKFHVVPREPMQEEPTHD